MTMDKLFLALHVVGALMWIGSLFAVMSFLEAFAGEPDPAARGRLLKYVRQAAIVPDIGATIALVFGLHWLFRFKLYEAHYMHAKLALVAVVLGLHVMLRLKVKKAKNGEAFSPPPLALKPLLTLLATGIVIFVIAKVPA
ncbi:MAG: hypothetical protein H6Q90_6831 [Deltaproteobacteria bacterium]|nr:hypothetical protein [Deltaproteobacteria bacterium]